MVIWYHIDSWFEGFNTSYIWKWACLGERHSEMFRGNGTFTSQNFQKKINDNGLRKKSEQWSKWGKILIINQDKGNMGVLCVVLVLTSSEIVIFLNVQGNQNLYNLWIQALIFTSWGNLY